MLRKTKVIVLNPKKLVGEWKYLCEIKKDAHIAISGDEGDGKTILLIRFIVNQLKGNLWDNMVYSKNPKEFYDKYDSVEEESGMGFDEGLDLLDRLNWAKEPLKELVKKFRGEIRKEKNLICFYNVQLFRDLHGYWRNHRIRYWIEVTPREWFKDVNMAFVLKRQRVPFITGKRDTWLLDEMEKLWLKKMKLGAIIGKSYMDMLRSHPFRIGEFKYGDVSPKVYKLYLKRRAEAKDIYEHDISYKAIPQRVLDQKYKTGKLIFKLLDEGIIPKQKDIAELMDTDHAVISRLLKLYHEIESNK